MMGSGFPIAPVWAKDDLRKKSIQFAKGATQTKLLRSRRRSNGELFASCGQTRQLQYKFKPDEAGRIRELDA